MYLLNVFRAILLTAIASFLYGQTEGTALSHEVKLKIENCGCDKTCYTKEITNLRCNSGNIQFKSQGLPNKSNVMMKGITATNQQFPAVHHHNFTITRSPREASRTKKTEAGPIGVAVDGVPIFNPDTQGPKRFSGGGPATALEKGELDKCGGHAGRGDDYHYHTAPKCLIKKLGKTHVEEKMRPIGYAMDGFPILALGWFDPANNIEVLLDKCRGVHDSNKQYFYNVQKGPKWDVLNCFKGRQQRNFNRDKWKHRIDVYGNEIVGSPIQFVVDKYQLKSGNGHLCHIMTGTLKNEQLLQRNMSVKRVNSQRGTIFYCNPGCYGQFFEADRASHHRGRVMYHERPTKNCPKMLNIASLKLFDAYSGPRQSRRRRPPPPPR